MVTLLHIIPIVNFSFSDLNVVILMSITITVWRTKKARKQWIGGVIARQPSLKLWKNIRTVSIDEATISGRLHTMGKVQKKEKWVSRKLTKNVVLVASCKSWPGIHCCSQNGKLRYPQQTQHAWRLLITTWSHWCGLAKLKKCENVVVGGTLPKQYKFFLTRYRHVPRNMAKCWKKWKNFC